MLKAIRAKIRPEPVREPNGHTRQVGALTSGRESGFIWLIVIAALVLPSVASASEHRSRAVAREFQREHPCPSTGLASVPCPGYWRDHIVPLACGGPDAVSNMQWQTIASVIGMPPSSPFLGVASRV
jgi:hypothetical protein